jgi:phospholipid transport system substrate-binding protein
MKTNVFRGFWFTCVLLIVTPLLAASAPVEMLESTSNQMINALSKNKTTLKNNPALVHSLVRQILLPHVDILSMSRSVLGRQAWNSATAQQQSIFVKEFTSTIIRTYSTAFASYTNEKVQFFPMREGAAGQQQVQVRSLIIRANGPSIPVDYRLILRGGSWKVYDFSVEGVSLVQSFRSQYSNEIAHGGIEGLLAKMQRHNQG